MIKEVVIEKLVAGGNGLARDDGRVIFVPYVLPGEKVRIQIQDPFRKQPHARVLEWIEPSLERKIPICPLFTLCGGCQWLHIAYDSQVRCKEEILRETLLRVAGIDAGPMEIVPACQKEAYRTQARLHVNIQGHPGYFAPMSHSVIPISYCPLHTDSVNRTLAAVQESSWVGVDLLSIRSGEDGEVLLCVESKQSNLKAISWEAVPCDGLYLKGKYVQGQRRLTRRVGDLSFLLLPSTFFQIHPGMTRALHTSLRGEAEQLRFQRVVDLYAGAGAMGLSLADKAEEVWLVERDRGACEDAKIALRENQLLNVRVVSAPVEQGIDLIGSLRASESVVVLDPPRTGCERKVIDRIGPEAWVAILYVSCDPATLARDLARLALHGWHPASLIMLDLFPQTFHIETLVRLEKA